MSKEREGTPLIDLAAVLVSPVLVMLMVGSLVFFLIEVLPSGDYKSRLHYTMFFFVIGAVLIARIAIQFGYARASLYVAGLGGACFVAMLMYVQYPTPLLKTLGPAINLGLMIVVWWSANKLTWDCTHFDDAQKASGQGVLAAAGVDEALPEEQEEDPATGVAKKKKRKPEAGFAGWWEKFQAYRAAQKLKPHTPGVWVFYFALAALPLFALGQSLISPDDAARRQNSFFEMAVYIGSALGLLVTTTLMGLRRYMEQRNAKLPAKLVAGWMGLGGALIVAFIVVGALLPRPHSETPMFSLPKAGSKSERKASNNAVVKDGSAGKGEGAEGTKSEAGDGKNSAKGGKQGGGNAGEKGDGGGKGDSQGGKDKGGSKSNSKSNDPKSKDKGNDSKSKSEGKTGFEDKSDDRSQKGDEGERGKDAESESDQGNDSSSSKLGEALGALGTFIKWIVFAIVAIAMIGGLIYFVLKGLAPFTAWAKGLLDWLKGLFGPKEKKPATTKDEEAAEEAELFRPPPFDSFANPFTDGSAKRRTPAELVEYTFNALESWAYERGLARTPGETPREFCIRLGHEYAELDEPGFRLADLQTRALYSRSPLPGDALAVLKNFWTQLESIGVRS